MARSKIERQIAASLARAALDNPSAFPGEARSPARLQAEIDEWARSVSDRAASERSVRRGRRYGGVRPGGRRDV